MLRFRERLTPQVSLILSFCLFRGLFPSSLVINFLTEFSGIPVSVTLVIPVFLQVILSPCKIFNFLNILQRI